jgi:hypothetical protein
LGAGAKTTVAPILLYSDFDLLLQPVQAVAARLLDIICDLLIDFLRHRSMVMCCESRSGGIHGVCDCESWPWSCLAADEVPRRYHLSKFLIVQARLIEVK